MQWTIGKIGEALRVAAPFSLLHKSVTGFSIDSRTLRPGEAFIAPLEATARGRIVFPHVSTQSFGDVRNLQLEFREGRIVDFLLDHGVLVFAINPKAVDRARDRFRMSGAKSDPFDARVLATFLRTDHGHLSPLRPSSEAAQELKGLTRDYTRQVRQQTRLLNQLTAALKAANPQPNTELEYTSVFELLTAVLLSAQATDVGVNKATRRLFPVAHTPQQILDLGLEGLESYIKTIGLYRSKARHLMETCRILVERHGGEVPRTREALEQLPGVGRKTANVVLNVAFGQPTMAVDTHIFRVANRTGIARGKDVRAVEEKLIKVVPEEFKLDAHHWLILHGRYVCKARKPDCPKCTIRDLCEYRHKTISIS